MIVLARDTLVDVSPNAAAPIAQWALDLQKRAAFARMGRGPVEFDCMGVVVWAQGEVGRRVRDYVQCYRDLNIRDTGRVDLLFRAEADAWQNVDAGGVGDVLVVGTGQRAHHVAVLCGGGCAVHATESAGIAITKIVGRRVRRFFGMSVFGCVKPN